MNLFRLRWGSFAVALLLAAGTIAPSIARADGEADAFRTSLINPANVAIKNALRASEIQAQARPNGQVERPISSPGLPTGLTYTLDVNVAGALGRTGARSQLPGGMDGVLGYGFNKHVRAQASYYDFQEYPLGFDTGTVPTYLQGVASPLAQTNLATNPVDVTTKNHIFLAQVQTLFTIGGKLPIVVTPTYLSRSGSIGAHSDETLIEYNGFPATVRLRTVQYWLLAVTLPFLSTPRMFGTVTVAPQWNLHTAGINTTNKAQLFELAYLEYRPSAKTVVFVQPSRLVNNLPSDATPQYIPTFIYGGAYKFGKNTFVQGTISTGTPSNRNTLGITALTLQQVPTTPVPPQNQVAPTLGGLKATQYQIQIGIGSPSVVPL